MDLFEALWEPNFLLTVAVCLGLAASYQYYEHTYKYWQKRGVKGLRPLPVVTELYYMLFRDRVQLDLERTSKFGKIYGSFVAGRPRLIINDAEVMRQILVKDFDAFQDHQSNEWSNKYQRLFLVWLGGQHWKRVRALMTPTFTSVKIKRMYRLLDTCADDLVDNFAEHIQRARSEPVVGSESVEVDLSKIFSMYTMDGITTCCYGIKLKRESETARGQRRASSSPDSASRNSFVKICRASSDFDPLRVLMAIMVPKFILRLIKFNLTPSTPIEMLMERVERVIEKRKLTQNKYDDLLQLLVDAKLDDKLELNELDERENHHACLTRESLISVQDKMRESVENSCPAAKSTVGETKLSELEILAEAAFLLIAGMDTTRVSLSTITFMLAHNQDVQERLYQEIKAIAKYNQNAIGKQLVFDYDSLTSCLYLDAVISESLRYFSPAPYTDRVASRDYLIEKYDILVQEGSQILFSLQSVQRDPDYWEEPDKFNPDRFMPGQRERIVPGSYVPFSIGPRHCLGMRFSLTETKLGLAKTLMNYKFKPAPKTAYPPVANLGIGLVCVKDCRVKVLPRES